MRLTKNIRDEIVRNALAVRFDKRMKDLVEEERALVKEVYDFLVPKETQKALDVLDKLDTTAWFNRQSQMVLDVDYNTHHLEGNTMRMPQRYNYGTFAKFSTREPGMKGELAKKLAAHHNKWDSYNDDLAQATRALKVLLKSVGSTESLAKVWPEGAKLYSSPPLKNPTPGLPAVQLAELNKQLGLVA